MGLIQVRTDKRGFATPVTPVGSQGMMRWAVSFEDIVNDALNGEQAFHQMRFETPTANTIASGVITPTLTLHTVTSESGTSDALDTITAVNNAFLVLKATATHTITLNHATGNINVPGRNNVVMTGNAAVLLFCENDQWAHIGTYNNKNNFIATTDPGSGDDTGDGYLVGSLWLNTQLDRLWICTDNTSTTAVWKRVGDWRDWFRIRGAAAVSQGIGVVITEAGGVLASANDANDTLTSYTSDATTGSSAGVNSTSFAVVRPAYSPVAEFGIKTGSDLTAQRIWIGMDEGWASSVDTRGAAFAGFRFSSVAGDTGWTPITNDGTTQTDGTTIGTVAINTYYRLRIRVDVNLSTVYFSVNNGAEQAISTTFPPSATDMNVLAMLTVTTNSARTLLIGSCEVRW